MEMLEHAVQENSLIGAFAFVGIVMFLSAWLGRRLTCGRVHGSAIAIFIGLLLAYWEAATPAAPRASPISKCYRESDSWVAR